MSRELAGRPASPRALLLPWTTAIPWLRQPWCCRLRLPLLQAFPAGGYRPASIFIPSPHDRVRQRPHPLGLLHPLLSPAMTSGRHTPNCRVPPSVPDPHGPQLPHSPRTAVHRTLFQASFPEQCSPSRAQPPPTSHLSVPCVTTELPVTLLLSSPPLLVFPLPPHQLGCVSEIGALESPRGAKELGKLASGRTTYTSFPLPLDRKLSVGRAAPAGLWVSEAAGNSVLWVANGQ